MNLAYCSAHLRHLSWCFQGHVMNKIIDILLGLSQLSQDEISFTDMNRWLHTESRSMTFISFWKGVQKDWFEKNWILEVGGMGARSTQWPRWRNSRDARTHLKWSGVVGSGVSKNKKYLWSDHQHHVRERKQRILRLSAFSFFQISVVFRFFSQKKFVKNIYTFRVST